MRKFLPAPTRENPFPADDELATHALIRSTRQNLLALEVTRLDLEAWSHPERLEPLGDNVRKIEQLIAERLELLLRATSVRISTP